MEVLDAITLRRRRDRLLNAHSAPVAVLEEAMFKYRMPPPFVFSAPGGGVYGSSIPPPFIFHGADPPPSDLAGTKHARPDPRLDDESEVRDDHRRRTVGPEADEAVNRHAAHKRLGRSNSDERLTRQQRLDRARGT